VIEMNAEIKNKAIQIKQKYKLKLPDAIIASTAILYNLPFISADSDFKNIKELNLIFLEK
jgi:predicted nucleic acid-binding protein